MVVGRTWLKSNEYFSSLDRLVTVWHKVSTDLDSSSMFPISLNCCGSSSGAWEVIFEKILEQLLVSDKHSSVVLMTSEWDSTEFWLKGLLKGESTSDPLLVSKTTYRKVDKWLLILWSCFYLTHDLLPKLFFWREKLWCHVPLTFYFFS